jgi:hypothetical protein
MEAFPLHMSTEGIEPEVKALDSPHTIAHEPYKNEEDKQISEENHRFSDLNKQENETISQKESEEKNNMISSPKSEAEAQEPFSLQIENDIAHAVDSLDSPVSFKNQLANLMESSVSTGLTLKQMREQLEATEKTDKQHQQQKDTVLESISKVPIAETVPSIDTKRYSVSTLFPVVYDEEISPSAQVKTKQSSKMLTPSPSTSSSRTKKSSIKKKPPSSPVLVKPLKSLENRMKITSEKKTVESSSMVKYKLQFEMLEKEKHLLTTRLSRMKKQLDFLTKENYSTKEELAKAKTENEIYQRKIPSLEKQLSKESQEADEKNFESNQLIVESHQIKARLQVITTRNIFLEEQLKQLQDTLRTNQKKISHQIFLLKQFEIKKKEQEQEKIEQKIQKKEQKQVFQKQMSNLKTNLEKKQIEIDLFQKQFQEITQEKKKLILQNQQFQQKNRQLEQNFNQLRLNYQTLQQKQQQLSTSSCFSTHRTTGTSTPHNKEEKKERQKNKKENCTSCRILAKRNAQLEQEILEIKQENLRLRQLHTQELQAQTKAYQQALLS